MAAELAKALLDSMVFLTLWTVWLLYYTQMFLGHVRGRLYRQRRRCTPAPSRSCCAAYRGKT